MQGIFLKKRMNFCLCVEDDGNAPGNQLDTNLGSMDFHQEEDQE
jgi:hypothetical protein